jgi:hypothetical protein
MFSMGSPFGWSRFRGEAVQFVGDVFVDGFIHRAFPINFGIQMDEMDTQRGGDKQQVVFGDAYRAAFDLGNGAAGGIVPAGTLQLDGKFLLRPAVALAQFIDLPSDQIQLLHGNRFSISSNWFREVHFMNKMQPLFLPQIRRQPVRKSHSITAAIFIGTHNCQDLIKVRFDKFPQSGASPHLGKYFCGVIKPTADRRSKLSPMKPQLRGAFALQAKTWPMIGRILTGRLNERSTKNECAGQTAGKRASPREGNGQAMVHCTWPDADAVILTTSFGLSPEKRSLWLWIHQSQSLEAEGPKRRRCQCGGDAGAQH